MISKGCNARQILLGGCVAAAIAALFGCSQSSHSSTAPGGGGSAGESGNTGGGGNGGNVDGGGAGNSGGATSQPGSGSVGSNSHKQAQKPAQETQGGVVSTDCVSPFQNPQLVTAADAPRCDCEVGTVACLDGMQFICQKFWVGLSVTDCSIPNACVDVSDASFKATTLQTCQSGSGNYECTWTISFDANLFVNYTIARGMGPNVEGTYRCDGFSVVLESGSTSTVATYDPASTTLTLDGVTYVKQ